MSRRPSKLNALLQRALPADLAARAAQLRHLQAALAPLLPPPLGEHCRAAALHDGELVLSADSPAWASRLRYLAPMLQAQLSRKAGLRLQRIAVTVAPPAPRVGRRPPLRNLSPQSTEHLAEVAEATEDPRLREALMRLVRHAREG